MRTGDRTQVQAHGFVFDVFKAASRFDNSGNYVLSLNGKYLARLHPAQVKKWARHFALELLAKPWKEKPAPTVAFYRITSTLGHVTLWHSKNGTTVDAKLATPYTRVQADNEIKKLTLGYRGEVKYRAVPVYN